MGTTYLKKCDRCGREARQDENKEAYNNDYADIIIQFGDGYGGSFSSNGFDIRRVSNLLCIDCLEKLNIHKITQKNEPQKPVMPADQVYDLIAGIVQECLQNSNR